MQSCINYIKIDHSWETAQKKSSNTKKNVTNARSSLTLLYLKPAKYSAKELRPRAASRVVDQILFSSGLFEKRAPLFFLHRPTAQSQNHEICKGKAKSSDLICRRPWSTQLWGDASICLRNFFQKMYLKKFFFLSAWQSLIARRFWSWEIHSANAKGPAIKLGDKGDQTNRVLSQQ